MRIPNWEADTDTGSKKKLNIFDYRTGTYLGNLQNSKQVFIFPNYYVSP
jgi:hypothetical protein